MAKRILAGIVIAGAAWGIAVLVGVTPWLRDVVRSGDNVFYDAFYHLRPVEDKTGGDVIIVTVDDGSLDAVRKWRDFGWPWPREFYGYITQYLGQCGARAVVFDMIFTEKSVYENSSGDDDSFASEVEDAKVPVIWGAKANGDGSWSHFAPPVGKPVFGAVNVGDDKIFRQYPPVVNGKPSLALAALLAAGKEPSAEMAARGPWMLHYYGPYKTGDGHYTFRYVAAAGVLAAALPKSTAAEKAIAPADLFRGKIVVIGATASAAFDLKSSPLSREYPGVEVQATAIANLEAGQEVVAVSWPARQGAALAAGLLAAGLVIFPRRAVVKTLGPILGAGVILVVAIALFKQGEIRWLAPTQPLVAVAIATVGAFAWTYFAEDKQRRFMLKALSKVVSPAVAEQLAREPGRLALGTVRTQITLLFTDLANFTSLSEAMDVQKLGKFVNLYLGEVSNQVLNHQGTLDKYIGDAVMCFWNAPLPQAEHAILACRAALAIVKREKEILGDLKEFSEAPVFTRIGLNTTDAAVGFVGSSHLFNYTALGDGVNLASRLEGANKIYGTRILVSQTTADLAKGEFFLRKVDLLRVKGKAQPMAVYELLGERAAAGDEERPRTLIEKYEKAFGLYQEQQWEMAEKELLEVLERFSDDSASKALLKRISSLRGGPALTNWDGVYEAKEK